MKPLQKNKWELQQQDYLISEFLNDNSEEWESFLEENYESYLEDLKDEN